jgi:hypothetical protein
MVDRLVGIEFGGPQAADLREQVRYNAATGSAVLPQTVPAALEYRVDAVWSRPAGREELATAKAASVPLPPPQSVPDVVRIAASQYAADAATDGQVAMALEEGQRTDGFFSHGQVNEVAGGMASLAGHGADRLAVLLTQTPMVGDAEQYASAMALMARSLGLPARVVLGYAPFATARDDAEATDVRTAGILTLRGDDVGAWVEICFEDLGWVAFHPTPDQDKVPREEEQDQQPEPQPQVVQPPVEEHRPDEPDEEDRELADTRPSDPLPPPTSEPDHRVAIISAVAGTILLALLAPPAAIWLAKAIRARRRERRGPPLRRVSRGWTELLDVTRDLQIALPPRATRNEIATSLGAAYPKVACDLATLAAAADQAVFSFEPVQPEAAGRYWSTLRPARRALRASHSRRRRLRARISLRSLSGRPSRRVPPRPGCAAGTR